MLMRNKILQWLLVLVLPLAGSSRVMAQQFNNACLSRAAAPPAEQRQLGGQLPTCSRVINVNIHFILKMNGTGNWNETDNGVAYHRWNDPTPNNPATEIPADTAQNGYAYARGLIDSMNYVYAHNPVQVNPSGIPNLPTKVRLTLNGVYFHRVSDDLYNVDQQTYQGIYYPTYSGVADSRLFDTYGVAKDSVVNLIIGGDYADPGHTGSADGISCTIGHNINNPDKYWVKLFNSHRFWSWRQEHDGDNTFIPGYTVHQDALKGMAWTFMHELGHLLGLIHTFEGANGCSDAASPNRCNSGNNLMDYCNQGATTPCQLDIVHSQLYNSGAPTDDYRNYLTRSACDEVPPRAFFTIASRFTDPANVLLDSRGTYAANGWQVNIYKSVPGIGLVRQGTYTKHGGLGQRWNLASAFNLSNGDYQVEMRAVKPSGQFHVYRQSFTIAAVGTGGPPACDDCVPPSLPDSAKKTGTAAPAATSSPRR